MRNSTLRTHIRPFWICVYLFAFLSLTSGGYIITSTTNYLQFYPAIDSIGFRVYNMHAYRAAGSNQTIFTANFTITNPSGYSGFVIKSLDLGLFFIHPDPRGNITLFRSLPMEGSQPIDKTLGPHSQISSSITIFPWQDEYNPFLAFNETYYPRIIAHAQETVELITFLEPVSGRLRQLNEEDLNIL